jgi:hypothetical protein
MPALGQPNSCHEWNQRVHYPNQTPILWSSFFKLHFTSIYWKGNAVVRQQGHWIIKAHLSTISMFWLFGLGEGSESEGVIHIGIFGRSPLRLGISEFWNGPLNPSSCGLPCRRALVNIRLHDSGQNQFVQDGWCNNVRGHPPYHDPGPWPILNWDGAGSRYQPPRSRIGAEVSLCPGDMQECRPFLRPVHGYG